MWEMRQSLGRWDRPKTVLGTRYSYALCSETRPLMFHLGTDGSATVASVLDNHRFAYTLFWCINTRKPNYSIIDVVRLLAETKLHRKHIRLTETLRSTLQSHSSKPRSAMIRKVKTCRVWYQSGKKSLLPASDWAGRLHRFPQPESQLREERSPQEPRF